jgi:hypothetical protein
MVKRNCVLVLMCVLISTKYSAGMITYVVKYGVVIISILAADSTEYLGFNSRIINA